MHPAEMAVLMPSVTQSEYSVGEKKTTGSAKYASIPPHSTQGGGENGGCGDGSSGSGGGGS
eukprot:CAMPEP_0119381690 /NCGR_PEP_ID=MMETSP1334-20130426/66642_1 /TAXON_ID=127549 /ORGANISM="Calcidiscus leptoporus, Strain RCC1130" /LENGTH=60 /DNA_ID=CAMNT_0007401913 /DNA_START=115 /DNA_END=294 /DNA_ORIENTATION=+